MTTDQFHDKLLLLFEKQNETMERVANALETIEKHSISDHSYQTFPLYWLDKNEAANRAVFETLIVKMKKKVEVWRNGMDSTLIFVALFVTVITAFQVPVSQNLSQNPADLTNVILMNLTNIIYEISLTNGLNTPARFPQPQPFSPSRSNQIVTLFFFSALLLSLIAAIMSVIGRQWVERLTREPGARTYQEKAMRIDFRDRLAEKYLRPILNSLHPILIFSITLFVTGILYQLWSNSFTGSGKPVILILTSSIGSFFIVITSVVTLSTFTHAIYCEESPFANSTAALVRRSLSPKLVKPFSSNHNWFDYFKLFCAAILQMTDTAHLDQVLAVRLFYRDQESWSNVDEFELAVSTAAHVLESDANPRVKHSFAWCLMDLQNFDVIVETERERAVICFKQLMRALEFYKYDPTYHNSVGTSFFVVRMALILSFSGRTQINAWSDSTTSSGDIFKDVSVKILMLGPGASACVDKNTILWAKYDTGHSCVEMENQFPQLFDNVGTDCPGFLDAIVRKDDNEVWKFFIVRVLNSVDLTALLGLISTQRVSGGVESQEYIFDLLHAILLNSQHPLVLPENFDLSAFMAFAVSLGGDEGVKTIGLDSMLAYLTIMDTTLLSKQRGSLDFLRWLSRKDDFEPERPTIRDIIPPADVTVLMARLTALPQNDSALEDLELSDYVEPTYSQTLCIIESGRKSYETTLMDN